MNQSDNKHCVEYPWAELYFWKIDDEGSNHACGEKDSPTRVRLCPPHNRRFPSLEFEIPRQKHELDKVLELMRTAYNFGASDRGIEIGKTLKSLISL